MENDKIYLQHNLNIEQFSAYLDLPVKEVSAVINKHFGTNFFESINSYRVEEAKHRLADPAMSAQTILDILLDSGFNSKSAFHRFFKRLVGESPSEYRKRMPRVFCWVGGAARGRVGAKRIRAAASQERRHQRYPADRGVIHDCSLYYSFWEKRLRGCPQDPKKFNDISMSAQRICRPRDCRESSTDRAC